MINFQCICIIVFCPEFIIAMCSIIGFIETAPPLPEVVLVKFLCGLQWTENIYENAINF